MYGTYITADGADDLLMLLHEVSEEDHRYRFDVMGEMVTQM